MTKTQPQKSAKPTAKAAAQGGVAKGSFAQGDVILIVGLGNPGAKYAGNRHNIGFMALDRAASGDGPGYAFGPWRSKFQGEISEARISGARIVLLKPVTFMNESGRAVGEACRFLKVPPSDVIVIHDELDLAPGKVRLKLGGGHAGHNGLRSIHAHIGADYARVRLGIGHPGDKNKVSNYVLNDFARADQDWLAPLMDGFADGLPKLIDGDGPGFQNTIGLRMKPPKAKDSKPMGPKTPHQAKAVARKTQNAAKRAEDIVKNAGPTNPLARLLAKFSR